ncbi:MAG TPA: hypothetical protein VIT22_00700 [Pseudoxanthomonas sp.]
MFKQGFLISLCLFLAACQQKAPVEQPAIVIDVPVNAEEGGALSGGPPPPARPKADSLDGTDWPRAEVASGEASISCEANGAEDKEAVDKQRTEREAPDGESAERKDGDPLSDLAFFSVADALTPCKQTGLVRLRYQGKIGADFTALVERVANIATRMEIERRILDIDSSGGHVEDAMKAGDAIGASRWTLRVREGAICHSACVLILAAGDNREIAGKVGIHRMIRIGSAATTRAELSQELREVYALMKEYLERNGAAVTVADLMMTVPNRKLRVLTKVELQEYGLEGTNAVQDDLERIHLTRKCGEDFVKRKDDFTRAFDRECVLPGKTPEAVDACGLELREGFGFPDEKCPVESPLSKHDGKAVRGTEQTGTE